jgi:hypothetical protein
VARGKVIVSLTPPIAFFLGTALCAHDRKLDSLGDRYHERSCNTYFPA